MRLGCRREMSLAIGCLICGCYSLVLNSVHGHSVGRVAERRTSTWSTTKIIPWALSRAVRYEIVGAATFDLSDSVVDGVYLNSLSYTVRTIRRSQDRL